MRSVIFENFPKQVNKISRKRRIFFHMSLRFRKCKYLNEYLQSFLYILSPNNLYLVFNLSFYRPIQPERYICLTQAANDIGDKKGWNITPKRQLVLGSYRLSRKMDGKFAK